MGRYFTPDAPLRQETKVGHEIKKIHSFIFVHVACDDFHCSATLIQQCPSVGLVRDFCCVHPTRNHSQTTLCMLLPIVIVSSAYSIMDKHWTLCPEASSADRLQPIIVKYNRLYKLSTELGFQLQCTLSMSTCNTTENSSSDICCAILQTAFAVFLIF